MAVSSGRATSSGGGISGAVLRAAEAGCAAMLRGIAVDQATARSLEAQFQVAPSGPALWEISSRRALDSVPFGPIGAPPPLLGRDAELAQIRAALRSVLEEARHAVLLVSGPPGIGKSRLRVAMEAELEGASEPIFTLGARAEPLRREAALSLVGTALKSRLYARSSSPNATILDMELSLIERRNAVSELVAEAIDDPAAAAACAEFLGELMGVTMPESPALLAAHADPQLMADRLRLSLLDFFEGLAAKGPVALLLEDLQWADQASLAFVEDLLDRLSDAPLLVFATARSELIEQRPALFSGRNVARIEPRGLISSDVAALARWIAGRPLPEALTKALAERTAGHPLFVEQIVLELKDHGRLEGEVGELPMTLTVEAAVQSRLDHLPPLEKDACKRAAIFGRPFSTDELEAMGVSGAASVLGSLGKRDLVAGRAKAGGGRGRQFQFRSTLVVDVAYGMLADEVRKDLHRRAALYLGRQPQAEDEEVGSHHERGGEHQAAAARYAAAALSAAPRGDTPTVLRCSEKALWLGAPDELRFGLHMARADALKFLGQRDEQAAELALCRDLATSDTDRARVLTERAALMSRTGRKDESLAEAEAAVRYALSAGDPEVITAARARHVGALIYGGELGRARGVFRDAMALADGATPRTRAFLADVRAQLAAAIGDLGERRDAFEEAVSLYKQAGDIRRAAGAEANLADVYNRVGAYVEASDALHKAIEGGRRVNNRRMEGYARVNLGYALSMQGKTDEALGTLREALASATEIREIRLSLGARAYLARAMLGGAAPAEVAAEAEALAAEADKVGALGTGVTALAVAASARLASGDIAAALGLSERSMAALERLGGIEEDEAEVFVTRARVLEAAGRVAEASDVRLRGRTRILEIAERISDRALRARFVEAVAAHRELMRDEPTGGP
jgi:tetratricopeptide (TPR) repeat protein